MRTKLRNPNSRSLGIGLVCFFVCFLALATCWTPPNGQRCAEPQQMHCTNDCHSVYYSPEYSTYCDSRDGDCGQDGDCTVNDVTLYQFTMVGEKVFINNECITCVPPPPGTPLPTGVAVGTCAKAETTGNQCGYCP